MSNVAHLELLSSMSGSEPRYGNDLRKRGITGSEVPNVC